MNRPYIHLVDGGISDNVGMRGVLDALQLLEALHGAGVPTPLDHVKRIVVLVVNSLSSPPTDWDKSEQGPGMVDVLLKSSGVPIDHYSYEAVELLKDISARWDTARHLRDLAGCSSNKDAPVCAAIRVPQAKIYAIDVSFPALKDKAEFDYLNQQPTTFVAAGRGRGSPARRGGDDHRRVARIPAAVEGRRRESRRQSCRRRRDSSRKR